LENNTHKRNGQVDIDVGTAGCRIAGLMTSYRLCREYFWNNSYHSRRNEGLRATKS
jgi:hypothetical protein